MEKKQLVTVEAIQCPYCGSLFERFDPSATFCWDRCYEVTQQAKFSIGQHVMASKSPRAFFGGPPKVLTIMDVCTTRDRRNDISPAYLCKNGAGQVDPTPYPEGWLELAEKAKTE